jgi:hypothetical protein
VKFQKVREAGGHPAPDPLQLEDGGHPAPDPLLLAVRAAINWSWRHHQKLLASGEPEEEEDELDVLAMEQFLEMRQAQLRPKTLEDLARGLGQPNGYLESRK